MKHIDLFKLNENGLSKRIVSQESNSFGDQILSLKELVQNQYITEYKIIAITSRQEGDWMSLKEMRVWSNCVSNKN